MSSQTTDSKVFNKFSTWYKQAEKQYNKSNIKNYNAFSLSTCVNNMPSSRILLLKSFSSDGFIFYTNSLSKKGLEISLNPNVAMLFYWPLLSRQVRVEGICKEIAPEIADDYFNSRPYLSKVGAWASNQSSEMKNLFELSKNVIYYSAKYPNNVPRPPHWKGYCVNPSLIEFWVEKPARLHIRKAYTKIDNNLWNEKILFP